MATDAHSTQARVTLAHFLYREAVTGVSQALEIVGQPPLRPDEKEILFGEMERAAWALPEAMFVDAPTSPEDWRNRADDDPRVREAAERGVTRILEGRRGSAPPSG